MSQTHTQYSFLIFLPDGVTAERAQELIDQADAAMEWDDEAPNPLGSDDITNGSTDLAITASAGGPAIEVYTDANSGDVHQAAIVTRWLLDQLDSDDVVTFEWADYSSNCAEDGAGGGLVMVNRHAYEALGATSLEPMVSEALAAATIRARLEYLRGEIQAERISMGELLELQGLVAHIDEDDVELLEWAGVPEQLEDRVQNIRVPVVVLIRAPGTAHPLDVTKSVESTFEFSSLRECFNGMTDQLDAAAGIEGEDAERYLYDGYAMGEATTERRLP